MRAFLIDTSGSFPAREMIRIRDLLRVGDRVIMFDTRAYDKGVMTSQAAISLMQFEGGGGTSLSTALTHVGKTCPNAPVTIITDGFIFDIPEAVEVAEQYMIKVAEILPFLSCSHNNIKELQEKLT